MIELNPQFHIIDFKDFDKKFTKMFNEFSPIKRTLLIEKYFGTGMGLVGAIKNIAKDEIIDEANDFQGIYVFSKNGIPFYVGISQHVVERIIQHVKGQNHFSSSFCYRLGANNFEKEMGIAHDGGRKGLDFKKYVEPYKKELMKCEVAFYAVGNFLELYLFEVYVAMKLGTLNYNLFKTH